VFAFVCRATVTGVSHAQLIDEILAISLTHVPPACMTIEGKTRLQDKCELCIAVTDWHRSIEIEFALMVLQHEIYKRGMRTGAPTTADLQNLLSHQNH
jgi:hypothetical protein